MLIHTNFRAIFRSAEYQVFAVSTKGYFSKYLSATQLNVTITKLNSALCFTGINIAWREAATEMNGSFSCIHSGSRMCASRIWPQALSTFQETTSSSITLAGVEAVLFKLVKPRLVTDQVLL